MNKKRRPLAKQNDNFIEILSGKLVKCGLFRKELAQKLGVTEMTIYNKMKEPDKFTLGEVKTIYKKLNYSSEDILRSLR